MHSIALAAFAAVAVLGSVAAQIPDPIGRIHPAAQPLSSIAALTVAGLDRFAINTEDQQRRRDGQPARYAIPYAVTATTATHGTWEQLDGTWSLWRLRVQAPDASHVNLGFRKFQLPAGARLQIYSSNYQDVVRPFDAADHQPTGDLWTPVCATDEIVVEIYVMTALKPLLQVELQQVGSGYRFFGAGPDALGQDGSGSCNLDVACAQGAPWVQQIPAIAAISSAGSIFCSGSMVNNTAQDGRNFFLTANHCGVTAGVASSLVCYWNYRNTTCGGIGANLNQFTTGATFRSTATASDFTLVELNQTPNPAWGVTYLGWNRGTGDATAATAIHHPSGDAKKISFEYQATTTTSYGSNAVPGNGSHIRVIDWDDGTTEGGSSGSPLFDQNKRVIGQLHGGGAACGNNLSDWYGRFSVSWTGGGTNATRLSNWLDPLNTGATTLDTFVPGSGGGTVAAATPYGAGCYGSQGAFAQTFAAGTFDLSGTASVTVGRSFVPIANGYTVQNGPNAWFTPTSANLGLGD
nr:serine protease [Planctomycetota bacterium]